jgi:hypothetical protein
MEARAAAGVKMGTSFEQGRRDVSSRNPASLEIRFDVFMNIP